MLIYLNVVCIAASAYLAGMFEDRLIKSANIIAVLVNVAVVMAKIAELSA